MIHEIIKSEIRVEGSSPDASLELYLLNITEKFAVQERPLVLVCPGGAYAITSEREGEPIAMQFNAMGYHSAVLQYSCAPKRFPTALLELSMAVAYLRAHAAQWKICPDKIAVMGFSAGGHLTASLGTFWNTEWFAQIRQSAGVTLTGEEIRPNGILLAYPVITSGEYANRDSFNFLLGRRRGDPELLERLSLEKQDLQDMPPVFLWHTSYDQDVPIENSMFLFQALVKARRPVEYHVFPGNIHGLALADWRTRSEKRNQDTAAAQWVPLAHTWLENWRI